MIHPILEMNNRHVITVTRYLSPCGVLALGASDGRLCLCDWVDSRRHQQNLNRLRQSLNADICTKPASETTETTATAICQLEEYFAGTRTRFSVPLLISGTDFQTRIWNILSTIPYGQTISYSELARLAGNPAATRAVANSVGANGISIFIPCHRIVGANHALTGYAGGLPAKQFLLNLEAQQNTGQRKSM